MPIGNQEIWDKGIGAGATNVIFGQPAQTNYNPGALGADPNARPAAATAQPTAQTGQQGQQWTQAMRAGQNGSVQVGEDPTQTGNWVPYGGTYTGPWSELGQSGPTQAEIDAAHQMPADHTGMWGGKYYVNGQEATYEEFQRARNQVTMSRAMSGGGSSNPALRAGGRLMSG